MKFFRVLWGLCGLQAIQDNQYLIWGNTLMKYFDMQIIKAMNKVCPTKRRKSHQMEQISNFG